MRKVQGGEARSSALGIKVPLGQGTGQEAWRGSAPGRPARTQEAAREGPAGGRSGGEDSQGKEPSKKGHGAGRGWGAAGGGAAEKVSGRSRAQPLGFPVKRVKS